MDKQGLIKKLEQYKFSKDIINAFKKIDRKLFVPIELKEKAYKDTALPIGSQQTISQPYTIAFMLSLLDVKPGQNILEVGSGSGYVLALLSNLNPTGNIIGIERILKLAQESQKRLNKKNYPNINLINANGFNGLQSRAPFDRILVSAEAETLPQKLVNQLKIEGILVCPVNNKIVVVKKHTGENEITEYPGFSFVPLVND